MIDWIAMLILYHHARSLADTHLYLVRVSCEPQISACTFFSIKTNCLLTSACALLSTILYRMNATCKTQKVVISAKAFAKSERRIAVCTACVSDMSSLPLKKGTDETQNARCRC